MDTRRKIIKSIKKVLKNYEIIDDKIKDESTLEDFFSESVEIMEFLMEIEEFADKNYRPLPLSDEAFKRFPNIFYATIKDVIELAEEYLQSK